MPDKINIDKLKEEYEEWGSLTFRLDPTGPIYAANRRVGHYDIGAGPLFSALGEAPKIILSLCNIIACNNEGIENQHKAIAQLKRSHDIAEKKLLRKVADAKSE